MHSCLRLSSCIYKSLLLKVGFERQRFQVLGLALMTAPWLHEANQANSKYWEQINFLNLFPSVVEDLWGVLCFLLCADKAAAECSNCVQVWAVASGLLPCPPVAAPWCGWRDLCSSASQVPPTTSRRPPLWGGAALPPDPLCESLSCAQALPGSQQTRLYGTDLKPSKEDH